MMIMLRIILFIMKDKQKYKMLNFSSWTLESRRQEHFEKCLNIYIMDAEEIDEKNLTVWFSRACHIPILQNLLMLVYDYNYFFQLQQTKLTSIHNLCHICLFVCLSVCLNVSLFCLFFSSIKQMSDYNEI